MDFSEVTNDLTPWLSLLVPAAAIAGGLLRYLGADRVRSRLAADVELMNAMPDGEAKEAVREAVEAQAQRLRDRVVHGFGLTTFAARALFVWLTAIFFASLWIVGYTANKDPDPRWRGFHTALEVGGQWGFLGCVIVLCSMIGISTGRWVARKEHQTMRRVTSRGSGRAGSRSPERSVDGGTQPPA